MNFRSKFCILAGLLAAALVPARAGTVLSASLNPVDGSTGSGFGSITISDAQDSAFVQIFFSGLAGAATGAGFSGAVGFPLIGVPFATSGSATGVFSITASDAFSLELGGGTFTVTSTEFPGGELFGRLPEAGFDGPPAPIGFPKLPPLPPLQPAPEPASVLFVFLGAAALLLGIRYRSSRTTK